MNNTIKLEKIALIHGIYFKGHPAIDLVRVAGIRYYCPIDLYDFDLLRKELTENKKFKHIYICTRLIPEEDFRVKGGLRMPLGLSLLKEIKSKKSVNKNTNVTMIDDLKNEIYMKLALNYGAENYLR